MYSLRISFCTVPRRSAAATPCLRATAMTIASRIAAGALIVMLMLTLPRSMPSSRDLHVLQAADGDAHLADFAFGQVVVGVVADLGRQVEGHGKTGLPLFDQVLVARVALGGGAEAGVLAHGPEAAAVHIGLHAARQRVVAGKAQLLHVACSCVAANVCALVARCVDGLDLHVVAAGCEAFAPLRKALCDGREAVDLPGSLGRLYAG